MPESLAVMGLLIAVALYALLVRRRAGARASGKELARALTVSNEIAMTRLRDAPRQRAEAIAAVEQRKGSAPIVERRMESDRRDPADHRLGRGRRDGGDRRVNSTSNGPV